MPHFHSQGIFVTKVVPDGPASKLLRPGDKLLEVREHRKDICVNASVLYFLMDEEVLMIKFQ